MPKEAFFSPDFLVPDEGNGFAVRPDTKIALQLPRLMPFRILSEAMVELAVAEGIIVTWRTDETIPVGFGTIQVVPVWRFLLEIKEGT